MARKHGKDRGLFECPPGSGFGGCDTSTTTVVNIERRLERKASLGRVYEKRKTEIREGRFFAPGKARNRLIRIHHVRL